MIVFLTLVYCALLFVLVKVGVIKLNSFWKVSPVLWAVLLFIVLFLPMQWGAPSGPCQLYEQVVEIVPNVGGEVTAVPVRPMQVVEAGDVLFRIDPLPFQATLDNLNAQLILAETRLEQSSQLLARRAGSEYEVQQYQSQVDSLRAQIDNAQWSLDNTVVRARDGGVVMGVTLRQGHRVSSASGRGYMSLVIPTKQMMASIHQNTMRHVELGQSAEVALKLLPGKIINGKVVSIASMNPLGQLTPSGTIPSAPEGVPAPYAVMLQLEDETILPEDIPGGVAGTAAIYTESVQATHVIRKIMIRMEAWMNFINPG